MTETYPTSPQEKLDQAKLSFGFSMRESPTFRSLMTARMIAHGVEPTEGLLCMECQPTTFVAPTDESDVTQVTLGFQVAYGRPGPDLLAAAGWHSENITLAIAERPGEHLVPNRMLGEIDRARAVTVDDADSVCIQELISTYWSAYSELQETVGDLVAADPESGLLVVNN